MNITTKFTVATEQGIETLLILTRALANEKFSSLLELPVLDHYIHTNFNSRALTGELNSLSNQWIIVYADDQPAGYARLTSKGKRPQVLDGKRAVRIADFGVLGKYAAPEIREALLEQCIHTGKGYAGIWINEYTASPLIGFFECKGFSRQPDINQLEELPLASVCLVK